MNLKKTTFTSEYIIGFTYKTHSLRKYKMTVVDSVNENLNGKTFFQETETPKDKFGMHGKGESLYYETPDSKTYKSLKWLLKSMNK